MHDLPSTSQTTTGKRRTGLYIGVVLIHIIIVVIAVIAVIASNPSLLQQSKITQVQVRVEYSGSWQGAYGDTSALVSWSGTGSKTVTLNRPSDASIWIISANAQKMDGSADSLRIMIRKTDDTILRIGSTTVAYGVAQIAYTIQD